MNEKTLFNLLDEKLLETVSGRGAGTAIGVFKDSGCANVVLSRWLQINKSSVELVSPEELTVVLARGPSGKGVVIGGPFGSEHQNVIVEIIDKGFPVLAVHYPTACFDEDGVITELKDRLVAVTIQKIKPKTRSPV